MSVIITSMLKTHSQVPLFCIHSFLRLFKLHREEAVPFFSLFFYAHKNVIIIICLIEQGFSCLSLTCLQTPYPNSSQEYNSLQWQTKTVYYPFSFSPPLSFHIISCWIHLHRQIHLPPYKRYLINKQYFCCQLWNSSYGVKHLWDVQNTLSFRWNSGFLQLQSWRWKQI